MNVALTARHKYLVAEKVKSGAYGSATEVVREGLRLLEAQDERQRRIEWLQREVEKGFEGPVTAWTAQDADGVRKMIARRAGRRG
jgi:antitoxin ParD1/3/4